MPLQVTFSRLFNLFIGAEELVKFLVDRGADVNTSYSAEAAALQPGGFSFGFASNKEIDEYRYPLNPWIAEIPSHAANRMIENRVGTAWGNGSSNKVPDTIATARPLHEAVARGADDVCLYLLRKGAKIEVEGYLICDI